MKVKNLLFFIKKKNNIFISLTNVYKCSRQNTPNDESGKTFFCVSEKTCYGQTWKNTWEHIAYSYC